MKKNLLKGLIVATAVGCAAGYAEAQETVAVVEETAVMQSLPKCPARPTITQQNVTTGLSR